MYSSITTIVSQIVIHRQIIVIMMIAGFVFGYIYRAIAIKIFAGSTRGRSRNIGNYDRVARIVTCIILFVGAVLTSFSPILLFASGFCLFEAVYNWCGLYTALGKNSCPIN